MKLYDFTANHAKESSVFPNGFNTSQDLFIICNTQEVPAISNVFSFDPGTVVNCTDLDESVRYTSFEGYDFISLVHMEKKGKDFVLREINIYIAHRFMVLAMPMHDSERLKALESKMIKAAELMLGRVEPKRVIRLYFLLYNGLLADLSDMLESLEDEMESLTEQITKGAEEELLNEISRLRKMAYTAKKQLRALSYLGTQIIMDDNRLIDKKQLKYFRNIDMRLKKLYDFAENLYDLSGELLYTYDSKLSIKMNDMVDKLTTLTLFFGPLTVITGIYGMNFAHMPELDWKLGYPMAIGIMVLISAALYVFFKRKKWM
ncbi:MAG: magnesium transporter CorA family protein [Clostridiales bacterium]|jgi:magnesium transporter|nr:magnesium transporter CorA family protein [Clostridiales bacterium]